MNVRVHSRCSTGAWPGIGGLSDMCVSDEEQKEWIYLQGEQADRCTNIRGLLDEDWGGHW